MLRSISGRLSLRTRTLATRSRRFSAVVTSRTPGDSYVEKQLPFSTDDKLRNAYVNTFGNLRIGLLLEDLDRLAGGIAYQHVLGQVTNVTKQLTETTAAGADDNPNLELPVVIVTAGCDSIQLFKRLYKNDDLIMGGRVVATGKSSMEVFLQVDSIREKIRSRVLEANFTMVARGADGKATLVPTVVPTTDEERELNTDALLNRERRKKRARESLEVKAPTFEEGQLIHNLFMDRRKQTATAPSCDLQSTKRQSVIVMQPQKKNIHNKIFGGYLMRLAFEQAWATAWVFTGAQPHFRAVDEINFLQPVEIGTICTFNSMVTYAHSAEPGKSSLAVVEVVASVVEPASRTEKRTNTFFFTFSFNQPVIPTLHPLLYDDAIKYLDGKRRCDEQHEAEQKDLEKLKRKSIL